MFSLVPSTAIAYPGTFYVCSTGIQGRYARQIDSTIDDGNSLTGSVRVLANNTASQADAENVQPANDATLYTVCMAF